MGREGRKSSGFRDAIGDEPALENRYETEDPVSGKEPRARGTIFVGFKAAVQAVWGADGLARVYEVLPLDARAHTMGTIMAAEWLPEDFVVAWFEALWNGPCEQRRDKFCEVLDRMMDFGFGRVRRVLLALSTPSVIMERAPTLWRYDHSHGHLSVEAGETVGRVTLRDHPYVSSPLSCLAIAEIYRYCITLTKAQGVTASHYRDGAALIVRVRWEP